MTDPDTLLRVQKAGGVGLSLLRGTEKAGSLLPGLKQRETRSRAKSEIPGYFISLGKPQDSGNLYGALFGSSAEYSFDAAFGEVAEGTMGPKGHFDGVATKSGLISVDQVTGGPFLATKIVTYTGLWVDGKPQVDREKFAAGKSFSTPVKAGQEYTVYYIFNSEKLKQGNYKGSSTVYDGAKTTLNLTGSVGPVAGKVTVGIGAYDPVVGTGQVRVVPLTLLYSGNTKTAKVSAKASLVMSGVSGVKVGIPSSIDLVAGKPTEVLLKATAESVADGQYPVQVTLKTPGAPDTVFKLDLSFKTLWLDTGYMQTKIADGHYSVRVRINSMGFFEILPSMYNTSDLTSDSMKMAVVAKNKIGGKNYGMLFEAQLGGVSKPFSYEVPYLGYSAVLRKNFSLFSASPFALYASLNDDKGLQMAISGYDLEQIKPE